MHLTSKAQRTVSGRGRFCVVAMLVALAALTYLDRACISTLAPAIMRDLGLSANQMSWAFSAFAIAYAAFEIPTGRSADRIGTRRVLTRIVVWWSGFTFLTAAATGFWSLLTMRFLFGAGEAGAWPCAARTIARWLPVAERGRVQSVFFAGALLAGGMTPLIVLSLTQLVNWQGVFVVFSALGLVWAMAWHRWFRDDPADHPWITRSELDVIKGDRAAPDQPQHRHLPWRTLFGNRNVVALCAMYFPNSFVFYFCITWLPRYLKEELGFNETALGIFTGLPLWCGVVGVLAGGIATDYMVKHYGPRLGRIGPGVLGYIVAGAAILIAARTAEPVLAAALFSCGLAASMFTLGAAWGTCQDIGGEHVAVVSATMNTAGQLGAIVSPLLIAALVDSTVGWQGAMTLMGAMFLGGAVCWCVIDPRRFIQGNLL